MPEGQIKTEGQSLKLSDIIPSKHGYTFLGWSDKEIVSDVKYQPGDNYVENANIRLCSYTMFFVTAGWVRILPTTE